MCPMVELVTYLLTQLQLDFGWRMNLMVRHQPPLAELRLSIPAGAPSASSKASKDRVALEAPAATLLSTWPDSKTELGLSLCASHVMWPSRQLAHHSDDVCAACIYLCRLLHMSQRQFCQQDFSPASAPLQC